MLFRLSVLEITWTTLSAHSDDRGALAAGDQHEVSWVKDRGLA